MCGKILKRQYSLKMYITMKYKFVLHDKNIAVCYQQSTTHAILCFKPHKTWRLPTNHRLLLHVALVFSTFAWLLMFLTEFPLICRSLFRYCGSEVSFWHLKNIVIVFIYTQIDSIRERGSKQANHLLVIFENHLGQNWDYLEQNWIVFEQIWHFRRATVNTRATKWRWGIIYDYLNNTGKSLACILFI